MVKDLINLSISRRLLYYLSVYEEEFQEKMWSNNKLTNRWVGTNNRLNKDSVTLKAKLFC